MFWKKSAPAVSPLPIRDWCIKGSPTRKYQISEDENRFLCELESALVAAKKSPYFSVTRMSNGVLSISNRKAYLGKIKLQGNKTWMQYMIGAYHAKIAEDQPLDEYIVLLKYWVKTA